MKTAFLTSSKGKSEVTAKIEVSAFPHYTHKHTHKTIKSSDSDISCEICLSKFLGRAIR